MIVIVSTTVTGRGSPCGHGNTVSRTLRTYDAPEACCMASLAISAHVAILHHFHTVLASPGAPAPHSLACELVLEQRKGCRYSLRKQFQSQKQATKKAPL